MRQSSTKRKFEKDVYDEITDRAFAFVKRRYKEEKKFKYDVSEVIFICSPSVDVEPSFIATLLGSCDPTVVIHHHWTPLSKSSSSLDTWYGAVAAFSSETFARVAVDTIQSEHRYLKVLFFKEIVDMLLRAEILNPKPSGETTRLIFRAQNLFPDEHIKHMKAWLWKFGKPSKAHLHRSEVPDNVVLDVEYPSQFQAYAAKLAMDRSEFKKVGIVSIELVVTENGKPFDKFVRDEFKKRIAEMY